MAASRPAEAAEAGALVVDGCDYCGALHPAERAHVDAFNGAQLYAVVCHGFTDFYTAERVGLA